ncbi:SAM-dependent methyltransferase [Planctomycetes bacterium K23_9]|uniref:Putative 23S rRNA ribose 2'-O-ribose methyltransferase n=1 Tax=Stieleria marina TaxID=1930275 RepID=A0A517NTG9_9BACT|nr:putative 23S rRNA ribose 2'-O-ribose methyltransferase [Planctomycetes bacterium K23_9]
MSEPTFAMLCCAHGAETSVKSEMAAAGWRLAFSRPGFVTAKHDDQVELPSGIFVRTAARSIGQVRSTDGAEQVKSLVQSLKEKTPNQPYDQLHVWPKDRAPIGRFGFEPGADEVSTAVAGAIYQGLGKDWLRCDAPNRIAQPEERVLDVVLVEPSHWFFGTHVANTWPTRWPGAVQPIQTKEEPVSRAYYKAAEAIAWSGFDIQSGDLAVEVGSAPGGACGRLLEMGCRVIGIDPAEMDPRIDEHPNFRHIRARAGDLPRKEYRGAKWLLVDSNVKPNQTLTTVSNIVTHSHSSIQGLLLTLKLGSYEAVERMDAWIARIQKWNPKSIQVRQLARNKCEVCCAVEF